MGRKKKEPDVDWSNWEREARQRTAWGHYGAQMAYVRAVDEENEYEMAKMKKDTEKIKEIEDKRKNRNYGMMIIS